MSDKRGHLIIAVSLCSMFLAGISAGEGEEGKTRLLLPASGELEGWNADGQATSYGAENLWEYINGAADRFLTYEFSNVIVQHYINEDGLELKIEIFQHSGPLMAFGIFSQYNGPLLEFTDIGNDAFEDSYSLQFWKGRYFVRVYVFEKGEGPDEAKHAFAEAVAGRIKESGSPPSELSCFPEEGLVDRSIGYVTEGVLGSERFPPAFSASYRFEEEEGVMYLFPLDTGEQARDLFDWYVENTGAVVKSEKKGSRGYIAGYGKDRYRGDVLAFHCCEWVGIILGLDPGSDERIGLAGMTVERIYDRGCSFDM